MQWPMFSMLDTCPFLFQPCLLLAVLQAVGRRRYVEAASHSATLAARVTAGDRLSREDYKALIASQFWLTRNHQQLLQTVAAMRAAGHELDQSVLLQVWCVTS